MWYITSSWLTYFRTGSWHFFLKLLLLSEILKPQLLRLLIQDSVPKASSLWSPSWLLQVPGALHTPIVTLTVRCLVLFSLPVCLPPTGIRASCWVSAPPEPIVVPARLCKISINIWWWINEWSDWVNKCLLKENSSINKQGNSEVIVNNSTYWQGTQHTVVNMYVELADCPRMLCSALYRLSYLTFTTTQGISTSKTPIFRGENMEGSRLSL